MLYILSDKKVLFVDLPAKDLQEINDFLKPEINRIKAATKKDYSICYKKESDEVFCIQDYNTQLPLKDPSSNIITLFSNILTLPTNSFNKADLNTLFSIDAVILKNGNELFIQSGSNSKIINKKGFLKKLLIGANYVINDSIFLSLGNKINAMYDSKDLCFDSTYGLRALSLLKFAKELSHQEICNLIPKHVDYTTTTTFNRKNSRILSAIVQDPKYFSPKHLSISKNIAANFNPPVQFPFDGQKLTLPNDQAEVENILSIIADKMFQSNYETDVLVKANSTERVS